MNYPYNDNILLHSIGFNPMKLEGILKCGIVSQAYAAANDILYAPNYNFNIAPDDIAKYHLESSINDKLTERNFHNISLVRALYISNDPLSAYQKYVRNGISFIVEGVSYIQDKGKELIKRSDEVIVKDYIPKENITGLLIPQVFKDKLLSEVPILPTNIFQYKLIKRNVACLLTYINFYNYSLSPIEKEKLTFLIDDLTIAARSIKTLSPTTIDYEEAIYDYREIVDDLNYLLSQIVYNCFKNFLGKEVTVDELVKYIAYKYNFHNIFYLSSKEEKRKNTK